MSTDGKRSKKAKASTNWTLNGVLLEVEPWRGRSLLSVLRQELAVCSPKEGCSQGECGSCTVLVDGEPVRACQQSVETLAGCDVVTWEGVPVEERRRYSHGLSQAGMGCGFCVPGLLMRWRTLCEGEGRPSRTQIIGLLKEHYCRCTGYFSWLMALQDMALEGVRHNVPAVTVWSPGGQEHLPRLRENIGSFHLLDRLLAGEPFYVDDLAFPHMLEAAPVLIPFAYGQFESVRFAHALAMEGVVGVLSSDGIVHHLAPSLEPVSTDTVEVDLRLEGRTRTDLFDAVQEEDEAQSEGAMAESGENPASVLESKTPLTKEIPAAVEEAALAAGAADEAEDDGASASSSPSYVGLMSAGSWEEEGATQETWERQRFSAGGAAWEERVRLLMPGDTIRGGSDLVGLVVGEGREIARQACRRVEVDIVSSDEAVLDVEYAHQRRWGREAASLRWERGDVRAAFEEAHAVVSGTWYTSAVDPAMLELPSCIAVPLLEGRVRLYTAGVSVPHLREAVADALSCAPSKVEVVVLPVGGWWGERTQPLLEPYVAQLATTMQRPVKLTLSRADAMRLLPKRHGFRMHISLACDAQGCMTGLRMDLLGDTGSSEADAEDVLRRALAHACGPYRVPSFCVSGTMLCSNLPNAGTLRMDGVPQVHFGLEGAVDMMSYRLGIDGWILRYHNVLEPGDRLPNGQIVDETCRARQALEAIREPFYKYEGHAGLACAWLGCEEWRRPNEEVAVSLRMDREGRCHLSLPTGEGGPDLYARVLEAVAHEAELSPEQIVLGVANAEASENSRVFASEGGAWAIVEAATQAARDMRMARESGTVLDSQVFQGVQRLEHDATTPLSLEGRRQLSLDGERRPLYLQQSFAAQLVVLHPETGHLRRVVTACDMGPPTSPELTVQRIEGAVHAGLGYALRERLVTEEGLPSTSSLRGQGCLLPEQMPYIQTILVSDPAIEARPGLEKEGAEAAMVPVAPALAAALFRHEQKRWVRLPMDLSVAAQGLESEPKE